MQARRQITELQKTQKKNKKHGKSDEKSKKRLKEEVVPSKLKIKSMFPEDAAEMMPRSDGSNNSKEAEEESKTLVRKRLDAIVSKGELRLSKGYMSVSESDDDADEAMKSK